MGKYCDLEENKFYLKRMFEATLGEPHFSLEERTHAEACADEFIDGCLATASLSDPIPSGTDTPQRIKKICLLVGAAELREMTIMSNAPNLDPHTKALRDRAKAMISDLLEGRCALVLKDGTTHPCFEGPSQGVRDADQKDGVDRRFFVQRNRSAETWEHLLESEAPEEEPFTDPHYDQSRD